MKISRSIFVVGIILLIVEIMIIYSDAGSNSENLVEGLVSNDVFDKIRTLYFFIIVILFFFGGIVHYFEKGMESSSSLFEEANIKKKKKK